MSRGRNSRAVSSGGDSRRFLCNDVAGVHLSHHPLYGHAGLGLARKKRGLKRCRTAVFRQEGIMHIEDAFRKGLNKCFGEISFRTLRRLHSRTPLSRRTERASSSSTAGVNTVRLCARASVFVSEGVSTRPRPRGASGDVTTSAGVKPC